MRRGRERGQGRECDEQIPLWASGTRSRLGKGGVYPSALPITRERRPSRGFRSMSMSSLLFARGEWKARSQGRGKGSIGSVRGSGQGTCVHGSVRLGPTFCSNWMPVDPVHFIKQTITFLLMYFKAIKKIKKRFYLLFLEKGKGKEKERERDIGVWLPLHAPYWGPDLQPRHVP